MPTFLLGLRLPGSIEAWCFAFWRVFVFLDRLPSLVACRGLGQGQGQVAS